MEVRDNRGNYCSFGYTFSLHTWSFYIGVCRAKTERVLLTKYKSYADTHFFSTGQCTDIARLREMS